MVKLLIRHGLLHDAAVRVQLSLQHAQVHKMKQQTSVCQLLLAQIRLKLGSGIDDAMEVVQSIEHSAELAELRN